MQSFELSPGYITWGPRENMFGLAETTSADALKIERNSRFIGIGIGAVGAIVGGLIGRSLGGHRPLITLGGAVGGAATAGFGGFALTRKIWSGAAIAPTVG
jgi:hypothetical protein